MGVTVDHLPGSPREEMGDMQEDDQSCNLIPPGPEQGELAGEAEFQKEHHIYHGGISGG